MPNGRILQCATAAFFVSATIAVPAPADADPTIPAVTVLRVADLRA